MSALIEKALEAAEDARILIENRRFGGACNRAYYAMFNAAQALLETRGHRLKAINSHATVLSLFSREFVRDGEFDADLGRALRLAERARSIADYERAAVTLDEAEVVMADLNRFHHAADQMISKGPAR